MKHCFIDVETTGLFPGKHSIIQLSGTIEKDGEKAEDFNFMVQPFLGAEIDAIALATNNIKKEDFAGFIPHSDAVRKFTTLLEKYVDKYNSTDKLFFIAYNAPFDEGFVRKFIGKYFGSYFWWPSIDVAVLAVMELMTSRRTMPNFKLGTVYETLFQLPIENAHDAMADIRATREIYHRLTGGKDA